MANPDPQKPMIDPRWAKTVQDVSDAGLTIHVRPPATHNDVKELSKALKDTSVVNMPPGMAARPAQAAGNGVTGQDFFSFHDLLGRGGMGMVYNARQESMARNVAVKTLLDEGLRDPSMAASFLREAMTTGALSHPNIVPVHFFGSDHQGRPFMVMKRIQGRAWSEVLEAATARIDPRNPEFDVRSQLEILLKVCDAVAFAHAQNIVHRDLKPANVMVGEFGEVMVMDWGLAVDVSDSKSGVAAPRADASSIAGTPAYMAPEMVRCAVDEIGPRTDVYLLGGILHEIVTGHPPHTGKDIYEVLNHATSWQAEKITPRPALQRESRELERIIRKAVMLKPAERYASVAALQADIRAFLAGQGDRVESEALAQAARQELADLSKEVADLVVTSPHYPRCSEIVARAQKSIALWGANPRAVRVRQEAQALFADLAVRGRDWGLAESILRDLKLSGSGGHALAGPIETRMRAAREKVRLSEYFVRRGARVAGVAALVTAVVAVLFFMKMKVVEYERDQLQAAVPPPKTTTENANTRIEKQPGGTVVTEIPPEAALPQPQRPVTPPAGDPGTKPPEKPTKITVPLTPPTKIEVPLTPPGVPRPPVAQPSKPPTTFAPAAREPWRFTGDGAIERPVAADGRPIRQMLANTAGQMLILDEQGSVWLWHTSEPPASLRRMAVPQKELECVAFAGPRSVMVAARDGEVFVNALPSSSRELMGAWKSAYKPGAPLQRLAACADANGWVLSAGCQKDLHQHTEKGAPNVMKLDSRVLCLQHLASGALLGATEKAVLVGANGQLSTTNQNTELRGAAVARDSACFALLPAQDRGQLHIVVLDLLKGSGEKFIADNVFEKEISVVAVSHRGEVIAAGSPAGELALLCCRPVKLLARARVSDAAIKALAFGERAAVLYSTDAEGLVQTWDIAKIVEGR